ncbi:MAG: DUF916 and DUF3324 domain-containing protein [Lactobacillaceae bacterium]|nr:DUF916 and DUF3324 domain-containing protein [Lactobacillaceae bacterium]
MKNKILRIMMMAALVVLGVSFVQTVHADDKTTSTFDVYAEVPQSQIEYEKYKMDLRLQPGQTENLTYYIENNTNKTLTFTIQPGTATTLPNGKIRYVSTNTNAAANLPTQVGDLIKVTNNVTVKAKGKAQVNATVTMPNNKFDGEIVGGISFTETASKLSSKIPLYISETENKVTTQANFEKASIGKPTTQANLQIQITNPKTVIVDGLKVSGTFKDAKGNTVKTIKSTPLAIAPNSTFNFILKSHITDLKEGTYKLKLNVIDAEGAKTVINRNLHVSAELAQQLSTKKQSDGFLGLHLMDWLLVILIAVIVFLVVFFIGNYAFNRRDNKKTKIREDLKK